MEAKQTYADKLRNAKFVLNPKTGRPYFYMSSQQAERASEKRGGQVMRYSASGSYVLVVFPESNL